MKSEQKKIPRGGSCMVFLISRKRRGHNCYLEIKPFSAILDSHACCCSGLAWIITEEKMVERQVHLCEPSFTSMPERDCFLFSMYNLQMQTWQILRAQLHEFWQMHTLCIHHLNEDGHVCHHRKFPCALFLSIPSPVVNHCSDFQHHEVVFLF